MGLPAEKRGAEQDFVVLDSLFDIARIHSVVYSRFWRFVGCKSVFGRHRGVNSLELCNPSATGTCQPCQSIGAPKSDRLVGLGMITFE